MLAYVGAGCGTVLWLLSEERKCLAERATLRAPAPLPEGTTPVEREQPPHRSDPVVLPIATDCKHAHGDRPRAITTTIIITPHYESLNVSLAWLHSPQTIRRMPFDIFRLALLASRSVRV